VNTDRREGSIKLVPRQNAIRVQKGPEFDVGSALGEDSRLERGMLDGHGRSRKLYRLGRKGPADTALPVFSFNSEKKYWKLQLRRRDRIGDAVRRV
jgi:hypothetical protein